MDELEIDRVRLAKLPVWAREAFRAQQRKLDELSQENEALRGALFNSLGEPVAVRDPYGDRVPVAWGRYDAIRFGDGEADRLDYLDVNWSEDDLPGSTIRVTAGRGLRIIPHASNVVYLTCEDR